MPPVAQAWALDAFSNPLPISGGTPGSSTFRKKNGSGDTSEGASRATLCPGQRSPRTAVPSQCTDFMTAVLFPGGNESQTLDMETTRGPVSEVSWKDRAEACPPGRGRKGDTGLLESSPCLQPPGKSSEGVCVSWESQLSMEAQESPKLL